MFGSTMELKCSFWSVDSPCGAEGVGLRICPLLSCTRDIESHLVSLGLGSKCGATGSKISEADLILNRAGKFDVPEDEKRGMRLFAPDIARTLQQTGSAENGLRVATQVIRDNERVIHKPDE